METSTKSFSSEIKKPLLNYDVISTTNLEQNEISQNTTQQLNVTHFIKTKIPTISYELNQKRRWRNIYIYIIQYSMILVTITLPAGIMLDIYTFLIFGNNLGVGYLNGVAGTGSLIAALPIGFFVDKWNREFVSKLGSCLLFISLIIGFISIYFETIPLLFFYMISNQIAFEAIIASGSALFSDALSIKERTKFMLYKDICANISKSCGPLFSLIFFYFYGNIWNLKEIKIFILCTMILCFPIIIITSSSLKSINPHLVDLPENYRTINEGKEINKLFNFEQEEIDPNNLNETFENQRFSQMNKYNKLTPYLDITKNIIFSFGAGMLVKFLPIYFKERFNFLPESLLLMEFTKTICLAIAIYFNGKLASLCKRPIASFLYSITGTIALFIFPFINFIPVAVILFILRDIFQNASRPIDQALLADYITSKNRGKWNVAFSFGQFIWSGSAFIGGYLSDSYGYRVNFFVAGLFYTIANIIYFPVIFFVLDEDKPKFLIRNYNKNFN